MAEQPFRNFDEFEGEVESTPISFQYHNEKYEVRSKPSFLTRLRLAKMFSKKSKKDEISPAEFFDVTVSILGEENVSRLEQAGIDQETFMKLLAFVNEAYVEEETTEESTSPKEKVPRGKSLQTT